MCVCVCVCVCVYRRTCMFTCVAGGGGVILDTYLMPLPHLWLTLKDKKDN